LSSDGLTFLTWVDENPLVYVTLMRPNLVRQLRIVVKGVAPAGLIYEVEMLEIAPEGGRATTQAISDRSLVYLLIEFNVTPSEREMILDRLNVL